MKAPMPGWIAAMLAVQLLLALFFLAVSWSHTASLTFGRAPPLGDILLLAAPTLAVVACYALARFAWHRGRSGDAKLAAFAPFPLAILLFGLLGAI